MHVVQDQRGDNEDSYGIRTMSSTSAALPTGLRLGRGGPLALVVAHTQYPDEHDRDLRNGEKAPDACLLIQVIREPCSHRRSSEEEKKSKDLPRPDIGLI